MRDYTLAVGDAAAYGFSAVDDRTALFHAIDYLDEKRTPASASLTLAGPDGILTRPNDDVDALRQRASTVHRVENTDDVTPADPTPPDCNTA